MPTTVYPAVSDSFPRPVGVSSGTYTLGEVGAANGSTALRNDSREGEAGSWVEPQGFLDACLKIRHGLCVLERNSSRVTKFLQLLINFVPQL
jgi:hypothetical protein